METVVVDDGSSDDTRHVVQRYSGLEVRLVPLDRNRGECGAMNAGIEVARGKFIAFLDADDEWLPGKIARQVACLQAHPEHDFVVCDALYFHGATAHPQTSFQETAPVEGPEAWRALLRESFVSKPCVMARREALVAAGAFDPAMRVAGDQDMWIRLAMRGSVGILDECLVHVHNTPGSLMKAYPRGEVDYLLPMIERHVAAQRKRLGDAESRAILAERYLRVGRCYGPGAYGLGLRLLWLALKNGAPFTKVARTLISGSPPVRWLKKALRGGMPMFRRGTRPAGRNGKPVR